ncbi:histidine phosphatase family protein [Nocardioides sp. SR21]|uniref:SixA phosphatase family protein n=1 Tax=Nocardioides sp. SR21 TaxID=2919501 RepID=UPI001FAA22A7|nr:histidine phosphatase family protein [Nocardioides sp. SR21]
MRTIVVMRHAKAEQAGPTDFDRPLADRGHQDAHAAGAWLSGSGFEPEHVLVSAALRTRETWASVAEGAGWALDPDFDRSLYAAGTDAALDLVREVGDDVDRLLVIGHNPTMASLAQVLDDGDADSELAAQLFAGYPTSAAAVFEYDGSWADLGEGDARLVGFHIGRA